MTAQDIIGTDITPQATQILEQAVERPVGGATSTALATAHLHFSVTVDLAIDPYVFKKEHDA